MSETQSNQPNIMPVTSETQTQRWIKYGSNVVLVSIIVIVLGFFVAAIAQTSRFKTRVDTTRAGLYSLKPQTRTILKDLKENIRIVSLYTKNKPIGRDKDRDAEDLATPVADLLDEYKRNSGGKIDVEVIDPVENPSKVDDLIANVTDRYGGEVKQYRDFIDGFGGKDKTEDQIKKQLTEEVKAATELADADLEGSKLGRYIRSGSTYARSFIRQLDDTKKLREQQLSDKPPNYKRAVDNIESDMTNLSENIGQLLKLFDQQKDDKTASEAAKKYVAAAKPRFEALKKQADGIAEQVKKLGTLKLDDLRRQLRVNNGILVMGPRDMKVLTQEQIWQEDPNIRKSLNDPNAKVKPRFAGEQQITSAILALTQEKKLKVAFVRPGGPPLTQSGGFFGPSGPLSMIAARLGEYNFEVVEKDLTGQWAIQQQMQQRGMPPQPEPSDEEIKDAVWVVLSIPNQGGPMGPGASIEPKVREHLEHGGSALFLFLPQADAMDGALGDWGIKARTDALIVHEPVPETGAPTTDIVELAKHQPTIFVLNEYGDHMLAKPVNSLDTVMPRLVPITTTPKQGIKQSSLLPVPTDPKTWGETNIDAAINNNTVAYDKNTDIAPPLYGGAVAEKEGGGRVVAIGSLEFLIDQLLAYPDRALLERDIYAPRFPGSAELFINSIFWLSKMEPMIAISPSAMEISRIKPMTESGQWFWRWGVLRIGMPLLVVFAGVAVYLRRKD